MRKAGKQDDNAFFLATRNHLLNSEVVEIVHKSLEPGKQVELHWHNYCECEFAFGGEIDYMVNDKQMRLGDAWGYVVTPKDMHSFRVISDAPVDVFSLSFDESYIDRDILSRFVDTESAARFDAEEARQVRTLLELLEGDYGRMQPMRENVVHMLISTLLILLLRRIETDRLDAKMPNRVSMQIVSIIHARFRDNLTIRTIADSVYMTPNYIGERFKEEMGVSINTYLMETRLRYARNLLKNGKHSVKEAAYQSGFNSTTHFSTSFKKRYGYSPSDCLNGRPQGDGQAG